MNKITCPRCGQSATVTFSRRGTERIHTHKRADGELCRGVWSGARSRNDNVDEDEDGSPLDADNDPDA